MEKATRIFDILEEIKKYPKDDILANRAGSSWRKFSTEEYSYHAHAISYGLLSIGLEKGDKVATLMNNRAEWNFLDMGITMAHLVHVPIYPTLSESEYRYIIDHCDCKVIVIGTDAIYQRVANALNSLENPPKVYIIDGNDKMPSFKELIETGTANKSAWETQVEWNKKNISTEELASIIYTSGTTGASKGVMLSHKNLCCNFMPLTQINVLNHTHKLLSFLPLCHVYERAVNYHYQYMGSSNYYAGSVATIGKDMLDMKADGFCAVPRIFEMLFDKLYTAGKDLKGIKKTIYFWAFNLATTYDNYNTNWFYRLKINIADKLIYSKWRAKISGKEMVVVSGGSAIQERIVRLFTAAKIHVYEGYGLTETSPVIAVNRPKEGILKPGTVGKILYGIEFKLAEDGEILTRGNCLMMGYYKDPEYTKQVIDEEGWFHTGDIGTMVDGEFLKITDRKKEIFKLSLGKYVSPQEIENKLRESLFIENAMVIGEKEKFASALVVPSKAALRFWCNKHNIPFESNEQVITVPEVIQKIQSEVNKINAGLADYKQIKRFAMVSEEWSTATGELSQTLKLRRSVIYERYDRVCRNIYNYDAKI